MRRQGLAESNPWEGQGKRKDKNGAQHKRPYNTRELLRLLHADPVRIVGERYGLAIHDLLRLGLMTGARLNELCELMVEDVDLSQQPSGYGGARLRLPSASSQSTRRSGRS